MPSDFHFKCPKCGQRMEYIRKYSSAKTGELTYVCWFCSIGITVRDLRGSKKAHIYEADLRKLIREAA